MSELPGAPHVVPAGPQYAQAAALGLYANIRDANPDVFLPSPDHVKSYTLSMEAGEQPQLTLVVSNIAIPVQHEVRHGHADLA